MLLATRLWVRLTFDRGTIVLTNEGDQVDLAALPGVLWDARVGVHRVPPHRYPALLAELRTRGVRVTDQTASSVRKPDVVFSCPELRHYQRSALEAWEARGRRGGGVLPTGSGKTCVALGAIARAQVPTLCVVPTRVLLHQWRAMLAPHGKRQDPARKFLVEIVGFWTREYLEHKFATLRKASVDNLIVCVDAERACSEGELPPGARVVRFKRKIDPAAVLALLARNRL